MTLTQIIHLLQFADSALPVGAFAFSNSLETAVEQRIVHDAATLCRFVDAVLRQSATTDGIAALAARRATLSADYEALCDIDARLLRCKLNEELRQMNCRMGRKLAELAAQTTENELIVRWRDDIAARHIGEYPGGMNGYLAEICRRNGLTNVDEIASGTELRIPIYRYRLG